MPSHPLRMYFPVLAIGAGIAIAIAVSGRWISSPFPKSPNADFNSLASGIASTEQITLFEGLPHQHFKRELVEQELRTKATFELRQHLFYSEPLQLSDADAKQLQNLILDWSSFRELDTSKKKACGGFHPDFAIEFRNQTDAYQVLICFGCREAKFYGPRASLHCELASGVRDTLKEILERYHKNLTYALDKTADVPLLFEPSGK